MNNKTRKRHLQRAIRMAGSQAALGRKIGVAQSYVGYWLHDAVKGVPAEYCAAIEKATAGAVTKNQLRPDIFTKGDVAA